MSESGKKILIIDDEAHIRNVIAMKLKNRGYQVMIAVNGEDGLHMIKTQRPSVVISDIHMPKMDGRSLCENSKELKKEWQFLTIIMTCSISSEESNWVGDMEDTLFMEKPFSPAKLMQKIDRYFGMAS
ncbi:MAG: response regulator [Deltaproteobacteria bacterium]|nr:response regulator [Deltaproteobacteria bacterium]